MWPQRAAVLLFIGPAVLVIAAACSGGGQGAPDPSLPTIAEIRSRAIEVVTPPGQVFHTTLTFTVEGSTYTQETWLYAGRDVARVEYSSDGEAGRLEVYHDGRRAELSPDERFQDAEFPAPDWSDKVSMRALDYLEALESSDATIDEIREGDVDGAQALVVEFQRPYEGDGYTGTTHHELYLDASLLPLRWNAQTEAEGLPDTAFSARFVNEFLAPESLATDFFSPEAVRAKEVLPAERVAEAFDHGIEPYWLGAQFGEAPLQSASVSEVDGVSILHLTYEHDANGQEDPPFGVTIMEFTVDGWDAWLQRNSGGWWQSDSATLRTTVVDVQDASGTLYEDPNAGRPSVEPPAGSEPTPATPLAEWGSSALLVQLADTMIFIESNVGPRVTNPYAGGDGLVRLANALRPYEAPP